MVCPALGGTRTSSSMAMLSGTTHAFFTKVMVFLFLGKP